ncbi:transcriptional regulator [Picosynechococcus sp. PCC 8807]|uniref:transcriptional regulator n=1 Tax=Picosynechococcus sp. PCC 8807 TaxID=195248 RepID=UPI0008106036|nr:transcriptional regulator [Picosynechococcus sp. PCC 8807]ANV92013.1 hypothetical protein AWQ24_14635 [Picosynechococcus sp. PCC 8807]
MEIRKKDENGIEFYTIELTGQSGMSQSALATLAGVSEAAISNLEDTLLTQAPSKYLEPFIGKPLTLLTQDAVIDGRKQGNLKIYKSTYCAAVLQHYADPETALGGGLSKEQRALQKATATRSCFLFMQVGIDLWIQRITGWDQRSRVALPHTNVYVQRIEHMRDHTIADDLWCVFREAAELLLLIEKDWRVPINDYDLLDGSIGRKWSDYRKGKPWATEKGEYIHQYRDRRDVRSAAAYSYDELPYFRAWLRDEYVPNHLPNYLITKYGKQATQLIYSEIGQLTDGLLELKMVKRSSPADDQNLEKFLAARQLLDEKFLQADN